MVSGRRTAVLLADDVIELAAEVSIGLVDQTVFAQALSPADDKSAELSADPSQAHEEAECA